MPLFFFVVANMLVMFVIGHTDRVGFLSIADESVPIGFWIIILVAWVMGALSGAIISTSVTGKMRMVWVPIHTLSAFVPFVIGLDAIEPYTLTYGVAVTFSIASSAILVVAWWWAVREEVGAVDGP